jgi:DNA-binding transcriptional MerR regulator
MVSPIPTIGSRVKELFFAKGGRGMYGIGELAGLAGVQPVTIRYYERVGLLARPQRLPNGYRRYSAEDLARLAFIRHCRSHDLPVGDIKELLALREAPDATCGSVNEIIDRHILRLDELGRSILSLRDHLSELRHRCSGDCGVGECPVMRGLMDGGGPPPPPAPAGGKGAPKGARAGGGAPSPKGPGKRAKPRP